jgi:flagellar protein FlgJ
MTAIGVAGPVVPPASHPKLSPAEERLKKTALQLEGVFVQRMFAAMRATVPEDGMMAQSSAESTFSSMLDEKFAEKVPTQWSSEHSLANALYRQLRQRLEPPAPVSTGSDPR